MRLILFQNHTNMAVRHLCCFCVLYLIIIMTTCFAVTLHEYLPLSELGEGSRESYIQKTLILAFLMKKFWCFFQSFTELYSVFASWNDCSRRRGCDHWYTLRLDRASGVQKWSRKWADGRHVEWPHLRSEYYRFLLQNV
jgi:hypothetical protein